MEKKLHDKDLLPGQKLPIEILPVQDAWAEMRKKMDDENPSAFVLPPSGNATRSSARKIVLRGSLLLFLLLITMFFVNQINKNRNGDPDSIVTTQRNGNTGEGVSDNNTSVASEEKELKIMSTVTGQLQNKQTKDNLEAKKGDIVTEPEDNLDSNKKEFNNKTKNSVSNKNKSTLKKQSTNSKKQKSKKKTSSNTGESNNVKDKLVDANSSGEMQTVINDPSISGKRVVDSTDEVKTRIEVKKDSSVNTTPQPEETPPQYKPVITVGLHWNFQLPVYGADNYFKGATATSRPYAVLLPGIWLSAKQDDKMLRAELNPFYSNLLPPKSFGTFIHYNSTTDSIFITTETKTLHKTFGVNLSAEYDLNISGNWWVGGGIHANWIRKGVASATGVEERRSVSNGGVITNNINRNYRISKTEWENFARFQIGIHAEANYITKKMEAGFRIGLPVTPVAKHYGQKNSIRTEMIFRLPLFNSSRKLVD